MRLNKLAAGIAIVALPMAAMAQGQYTEIAIDQNGTANKAGNTYDQIITDGSTTEGLYKIATTAVIPKFIKVSNFKNTIVFGNTGTHEMAPTASSGDSYEYATNGWNTGAIANADKATLQIESNETLVAVFATGSALKTFRDGDKHSLPTQFAVTVTGNMANNSAGHYDAADYQPWATAVLTDFAWPGNMGGVRKIVADGTYSETVRVHYGNWTEINPAGGFHFEAGLGVKRAGLNDASGTYTQIKDDGLTPDPATITITKLTSGLE